MGQQVGCKLAILQHLLPETCVHVCGGAVEVGWGCEGGVVGAGHVMHLFHCNV